MKYLTIFMLLFSANTFAERFEIKINAFIDGRDHLIISNRTLQWLHLDFAAVGTWSRYDEPTIISTKRNGRRYMRDYKWMPLWGSRQPKESDVRDRGYSSALSILSPEFNICHAETEMVISKARGKIKVIQEPTNENLCTSIIEFNDNRLGGADYYEVTIIFETKSKLRRHNKKPPFSRW